MSKKKEQSTAEDLKEPICEVAPTEIAEETSEETITKKDFDQLNDKYLRTVAEYDNFRKRTQRERESAYSEAISYAVSTLLSTYDNLERALKQPTEDTEYKKGIELTFAGLLESLEKLGVMRADCAVGSPFDPNFHNAVMHVEEEALGENVIAEVFQQGFVIGDKVVRHCMVKVAN